MWPPCRARGQCPPLSPCLFPPLKPSLTPHCQIKTLGVGDEPPACDPLVCAPQSHWGSFRSPSKYLRRRGVSTHRPCLGLATCCAPVWLRDSISLGVASLQLQGRPAPAVACCTSTCTAPATIILTCSTSDDLVHSNGSSMRKEPGSFGLARFCRNVSHGKLLSNTC